MTYQEKLSKIKNGLLPKECVPKPKKQLNKISPKRKQQLAGDKDESLDLWFEEQRHWLEGVCNFCGEPTTWKNKDLWRIAIAHLLPKSKFKSVATHGNNWVELCWDCHTMFDNGKITWELLYDSMEWALLRAQLERVLPMVKEEEKKNKLYDKLINLVYK